MGESESRAVSICTVSTPAHTALLVLNHALAEALNPRGRAEWIVTDNGEIHLDRKKSRQLHEQESLHAGDLRDYLPDARILSGPSLQQAAEQAAALSGLGDDPPAEQKHRLNKALGSYHHAFGLNAAFAGVTTRFAIAMDPDFYVVRPNWIEDVIDHMAEKKLTAFGAPWNPRWYQKFRYFPCTHFLVLDLDRLQWRENLLNPDLIVPGPKYLSPFWRSEAMRRDAGLAARLLHLARNLRTGLSEDLRQRKTIGVSRDTGYRLVEAFAGRSELKSDVLNPVFNARDGFIPDAVSAFQRNPLLDALLTDRLSYVPKRKGYASPTGFGERGLPDFRARGWEEFMWRGEPFAFHVRGELQRRSGGAGIEEALARGLDSILTRLGREPLAR